MHRILQSVLIVIAICVTGCSHHRPSTQPATTAPASFDPNIPENLTLDRIEPRPILPATRPTTQPAPIDALVLYARARDANTRGEHFIAIALLEQATRLDPQSADLWQALGQEYLWRNTSPTRALDAYNRAVQIQPDNLELQLQLARLYLANENDSKAMEHLRLALQTSDYRTDPGTAVLADYLLARLLHRHHYDHAALVLYEKVISALSNPAPLLRGHPDLFSLTHRLDLLYSQVAELYTRHGDTVGALRNFRLAALAEPGNLNYEAGVIRCLLALKCNGEATRRAADTVMRFRASSASMELLREVYRTLGQTSAIVDELRRLHVNHPEDRAIFFALVDQLRLYNQQDQAEELLRTALANKSGEFEYTNKLFDLYNSRNDVLAAAQLLIESSAAQPDTIHQMGALWSKLLQPSRTNRLREAQLEKLTVSPKAEAARLFWIARIADLWNRDALARNSLQQAVKLRPLFPPAFRVLLNRIWQLSDLDDGQKTSASDALADQAAKAGDLALADELRGMALINRIQPRLAVTALAEAIRLAPTSIDRQLNYIVALRSAGSEARAEQLLWKLVSDHPFVEDVWVALFNLYLEQRAIPQAEKVLDQWLAADPGAVRALLFQAMIALQRQQYDLAEKILLPLFTDHNDSAEVLSTLRTLYTRTYRMDEFLARLEDVRKKEQENRPVAEALIVFYIGQNRMVDAMRVLDAMRLAVASDPELLYYVSGLYERINQRDESIAVLRQVLKIDPNHPAANNDLGYFLADRGENLDQSENLIRRAVENEPDNPAFLDSLGWVLYKRGKFDKAVRCLRDAVGPGNLPDPIVLDHLGDALYRQGYPAQAAANWKRALERLGNEDLSREELKKVRQQLQLKLGQFDKGEHVSVAPIVDK